MLGICGDFLHLHVTARGINLNNNTLEQRFTAVRFEVPRSSVPLQFLELPHARSGSLQCNNHAAA